MPVLVAAAGGVLWRQGPAGLEVAVVHRPRYDDWSFPKGKLSAGEQPLVAAVREVGEETGLSVVVGRRLPTVNYRSAGVVKTVEYWSMQAAGDFVPNDEVDDLQWQSPVKAAIHLSYQDDVAVLEDLQRDGPGPVSILLVRHARAGNRTRFDGPDTERPLDERGLRQAEQLAERLTMFGVTAVYAADRVRCVQTVQPTADRLGLTVALVPVLSEEGYWPDPREGRRALTALMPGDGAAVVCSQGGVIPDLLSSGELRKARRTGTDTADPPARKASVWALSAWKGRLVSADYYSVLADS